MTEQRQIAADREECSLGNRDVTLKIHQSSKTLLFTSVLKLYVWSDVNNVYADGRTAAIHPYTVDKLLYKTIFKILLSPASMKIDIDLIS